MNKEEFEIWKDSVFEHFRMLNDLVDDRLEIKELMAQHLKQFFDYDEIKFTDDFNKIILKYRYENNPVIDPKKLQDLNMVMIIGHEYSETLGDGVIIELYPFGLEESGG